MIRGALVNMFTDDIERSLRFYARFGFEESFRTPEDGPPAHVEAQAAGFTLGFSTPAAALHHVGREVEVGARNCVFVFWVDDVDALFAELVEAGAPALVPPEDHGSNRSGWVGDPNGNQVELVQKVT